MVQGDRKKKIERFYVEEAARFLSEEWQLTPHEAPDFLVECSGQQFGLEITEVHIGPKTKSGGSDERRIESTNHDWLMGIRTEFAKHSASELRLRYNGPQSDITKQHILSALIAEDFDRKPILHRLEKSLGQSKFWATKVDYPSDWQFLRDKIGWVAQDGKYLNDAIAAKACKLAAYRKVCGDVRLLVIANRRVNSGKLKLEENFMPDLCGFNMVYFLSHPEGITLFSSLSC
jgi:hypothetical protein